MMFDFNMVILSFIKEICLEIHPVRNHFYKRQDYHVVEIKQRTSDLINDDDYDVPDRVVLELSRSGPPKLKQNASNDSGKTAARIVIPDKFQQIHKPMYFFTLLSQSKFKSGAVCEKPAALKEG